VAGVVGDDEVSAAEWGSLGHDPVRAREVLAAAGYRVPRGDGGGTGGTAGRDIPPIEILTASAPLQTRTAEWLQDAWRRELGIEVRVRALEEQSARDAQKSRDYDLGRSSWIGDYLDPLAFLEIFATGSPNNRTGWSEPRYDELIAAAARAPAGEIRTALLFEAERLLLTEGPVIPLWYGVVTSLVSPRVEGVGANPLEWELPKRLRFAKGAE
jgi:ABC-type oligopeptide transport system substrate-binding subunit